MVNILVAYAYGRLGGPTALQKNQLFPARRRGKGVPGEALPPKPLLEEDKSR
jgi:hypothetical protein